MNLEKFLDDAQFDLDLFALGLCGIELDKWQSEAGKAYTAGDRQISVRSGHGVGKTAWLSLCILHFVSAQLGRKVAVTAPTSSQLQDALIPEIKVMIGKMPSDVQPMFHVKQDRVEYAPSPSENFVSFKTSRQEQPDALAGVHAPGGVLLVGDEASGIPDAVFEFASGSMSGDFCQMLLTGNPVRTSGLFWKTHTILSDTWTTFHVSCLESRFVTERFIEEKKKEYGEESNAYRVRVLGEFPEGEDDTVIPLEHVESAVNRDVLAGGDIVWGLDVARYGSDRTAICKRHGRVVTEPIKLFSKFDGMEVVGFVMHEWNETPPEDRPQEIMVDSIGMGGPVLDRLKELGLPAIGVNVAELNAMTAAKKCHRLRDELWWDMRQWFATKDVSIPDDRVLTTELAMPRYGYTSADLFKVETKDQMRARGARSPDAAESLMLTFASAAAIGSHGRTRRRKQQRRRIKGIV